MCNWKAPFVFFIPEFVFIIPTFEATIENNVFELSTYIIIY